MLVILFSFIVYPAHIILVCSVLSSIVFEIGGDLQLDLRTSDFNIGYTRPALKV